MTRHVVIAIDGPAASGKSSTAIRVAQRLGFRHVDSGALYRAATAAYLRESGERDVSNWPEAEVLRTARNRVRLEPSERSFVPHVGGAAADEEIRGPEVTKRVSAVASMLGVRAWVNEQVRAMAATHSVVVDGRDIGSTVLPGADLKIFLVADPWERARRRLLQDLKREPTAPEIAEETDRLVHRDASDAQQSGQATDAVVLDTTHLTQAEQVDRIVALANVVTQRTDDTSRS
jgi:cytidylate kinase